MDQTNTPRKGSGGSEWLRRQSQEYNEIEFPTKVEKYIELRNQEIKEQEAKALANHSKQARERIGDSPAAIKQATTDLRVVRASEGDTIESRNTQRQKELANEAEIKKLEAEKSRLKLERLTQRELDSMHSGKWATQDNMTEAKRAEIYDTAMEKINAQLARAKAINLHN